jgi:trk system potassium uptake protein TrkH
MERHLRSVPLVVVLVGLGALAMLLPAIHAAIRQDWTVARAFLHSSLAFGLLHLGIAVAARGRDHPRTTRSYLVALAGAFTLVPLTFAVPVVLSLPAVGYYDAWFEMVSSFTTTGATLLPAMPTVSPSVHLWRAEVGWLGGFLAWVMAAAIFAPLNLGGYEVSTGARIGREAPGLNPAMRAADPGERLVRFAVLLFPVYTGLTLALWLLLILFGADPLVGLCHAMSTLATSGISPVGGLGEGGGAGIGGEVAIALFLVFAVSRMMFRTDERARLAAPIRDDPELSMAAAIVLTVVALLFVRHWFDPRAGQWVGSDALGAIWGTFFTALSFLTTTGFEGSTWAVAQSWSGLQTPALLLMGLAVFGGGVATTASGVKLLRIYALYKHGLREMDRLVHPSSVGGSGSEARRIRRQGAYISWLFFMLFAIAIAATGAALALTGVEFRSAMILTIAGLANTGPLAAITGEEATSFAALSTATKSVFAAAMVVGRLELLALIALANPAAWRS